MAFPIASFLVVACFVIGGQGVAAHLSSVIQLCSAVNGSCLSDLECCGQLVCSSITPGVASCSSAFSKESHIRVRRQAPPGQPGGVPVFNRLPAGVLNQWQGINDQPRPWQLQRVSNKQAGAIDKLRYRTASVTSWDRQPLNRKLNEKFGAASPGGAATEKKRGWNEQPRRVSKEQAAATDRLRHRTTYVTSSHRQALNRELNEKFGAAAPGGGDEMVAATQKKRGWTLRRIGHGFKEAGGKIRTAARNVRHRVRNFKGPGKWRLASRRGNSNKKRGWKTKLRQGGNHFRDRVSRIQRPRTRLPGFKSPSFSTPPARVSRPSFAGFKQRVSGWRRPPRFGRSKYDVRAPQVDDTSPEMLG